MIQKFKEEALLVEVGIMQDCYPGNPKYIGRQTDKKTNEYLIKSCKEQNLKMSDIESPYHYYPVRISESEIESYYNDALYSTLNMPVSGLERALLDLKTYSYEPLYKALDVLSSRFANDEEDSDGARIDVKRFKNIFYRQFNYQLPLLGRITHYFIGSLRRELQLRNKYLDMLRNKFKEMIAIEEKAVSKSQSNANSRILKNKTSLEDNSYFVSEKYKNMNDSEILNKIEELTTTEYEEEYYLGGYNESTLTTLDPKVISITFGDIYEKLSFVFRHHYIKGNIDLLRRIRAILHDDLKTINDLYEAGEWVPKCNYEVNFEESIDRDKSFELIYRCKTDYIQKLIDKLDGYASETDKKNRQQTINDKYAHYTALQWGAIIYYANTERLLPKNETVDKMLSAFKLTHNVDKKLVTLRNRYYEAIRRINDECNFPISNLENIIPFLNHHYKETVSKVYSDIDFLKTEGKCTDS